jgi:hypothetical protein
MDIKISLGQRETLNVESRTLLSMGARQNFSVLLEAFVTVLFRPQLTHVDGVPQPKRSWQEPIVPIK